MKEKQSRIEAIKMLIATHKISSQDELAGLLRRSGFQITQTTLSRDLKRLKVVKTTTTDGQYQYILPDNETYKRIDSTSRVREMMQQGGFVSLQFTGNMAVMKTIPGYAAMIASNIDNSHLEQIVGTIAGNDTIFIALSDNADHEKVKQNLTIIIPEIH